MHSTISHWDPVEAYLQSNGRERKEVPFGRCVELGSDGRRRLLVAERTIYKMSTGLTEEVLFTACDKIIQINLIT